MKEPEFEKPTCRLTGTDGNVFAIIGNVRNTLRRAGLADKADEFTKEAMSGKYDYSGILGKLVHEYVEVE